MRCCGIRQGRCRGEAPLRLTLAAVWANRSCSRLSQRNSALSQMASSICESHRMGPAQMSPVVSVKRSGRGLTCASGPDPTDADADPGSIDSQRLSHRAPPRLDAPAPRAIYHLHHCFACGCLGGSVHRPTQHAYRPLEASCGLHSSMTAWMLLSLMIFAHVSASCALRSREGISVIAR
jgi:hypothetical protein